MENNINLILTDKYILIIGDTNSCIYTEHNPGFEMKDYDTLSDKNTGINVKTVLMNQNLLI